MNNYFRRKIALVMALLMFFSNVPFAVLANDFIPATVDGPACSIMQIMNANPVADTHTYIFKVDGAKWGDEQIVKNGQYLVEPEAPEKENHKFIGWFVGEEQVQFGSEHTIEVTETIEEIIVNAKFEEVYYVFFMDGTGDKPSVFMTKEGGPGDEISTDVTLPLASTQAVTGWYKDKSLTDGPVGANYTIDNANQTLWPKIEEGHYLYFDSGNQGTYIAPQFVLPGNGTVKPTNDPTRPGYTFSHWSETDGGSEFTFGHTLGEDKTLYAVWTANDNTPYTVVFWKQSVNDDKNAADSDKTYDYAESEIRTATTEDTVSPTAADGSKNYQGFHYNSGKSGSVTVNGNGTTILNVYYDRNILTIYFHKYIPAVLDYNDLIIINAGRTQPDTPEGYQYWKRVRTSWSPRRYDYYFAKIITPESNGFEYTGLYGQTLAQNQKTWPDENKWKNSSGSNTLTFLDSFIFDDLPSYGNTTDINVYAHDLSGSSQIIHYKEALDGSWVSANTTQTDGGTFNFSNKYTGFTVFEYKADNGSWTATSPGSSAYYSNKLEVHHKRNTYQLAFYNYNITWKEEPVLFEDVLDDFASSSYTPPRPEGLPTEYLFQGWYEDKACSEPFNFSTETMPSNDLMIYAKWAPPVVNGTFYLNVEGSGSDAKSLTYGEEIDKSAFPKVIDHLGNILFDGGGSYTVTVPENHQWIGWSTKVGSDYIVFNRHTKIYNDIELYPYYVNIARFNVIYNEGAGSGTPPKDLNKYAQGAYANILSPTGLTAPEGKVFLGWENGGIIYQPGGKIQITGNMTLTAQWGLVKDKTKVTYKPGAGGIGTDFPVDQLLINERITLLTLESCGFSAKVGYEFIGWENATDNQTYPAGTEMQVDAENEDTQNILTAQWKRTTKDIKAEKSWVGGPSPRPTIHFKLYRNIEGGTAEEVPESEAPIKELPDGTTSVTWNSQFTHDTAGNAYTFSVKEVDAAGNDFTPANYTKVESGLTVTNSYVIPTDGEAEATKVWENGPSTHPTVWFKLYRSIDGGVTVEEVPESQAPIKDLPDGTTSVTWDGLEETDTAGNAYTFSVKEVDAAGNDFTPANYTKVESGLTVTNSYVIPTDGEAEATKVWENGPSTHPTVWFKLYRSIDGGVTVEEVPESQAPIKDLPDGTTSVTWDGLEETDTAGNAYTFSVKEVDAAGNDFTPANYTKVESGLTVTNSYVIPTDGEAEATKVWENGPSTHPTVWFKLYRSIDGGVTVEEVPESQAPIKDLPDGTTSVTWDGLEETDTAGNAYTFSVKEVDAAGNDFTPANYTKVESGLTVTNSYVIPTDGEAEATKVWENGPSTHPTVWFKLYRSIDGGVTVEEVPESQAPIKDLPDGTTSVTWDGLEETDTAGNAYTFSVKEVDAAGNDFTPANYTKVESGLTVTNSYVIPTDGEAEATKVWENGPSTHPTVWFKLYRSIDGGVTVEEVPESQAPIKDLPDGTTSVTWDGLEETDTAGNAYTFSVKEVDAAGNDFTPANYTKVESGLTVTNSYVIPTDGEAEATKVWENGPSTHPTVWFKLYRSIDGGVTVEEVPESQAPIKDLPDGTTSVTWDGLEETDTAGNAYTFSVKEVDAAGNDFTPANYTKVESGLTVTNSYVIPTDGEAEATKVWENGPSTHPTVWFKLYRSIDGGVTVEEVPESQAPIKDLPDGTTSVTWDGLEETDTAGNAYTFSVKEVDAAGNDFTPANYTKVESGLTVTNSYVIPTDGEAEATKVWENGPSTHPTVWFKLYRSIDGGVTVEEVPESQAPIKDLPDGTTSVTWDGLEETDTAGNAYTFSVKEVDAAGNDFTPANYSKSGEGTLAITNTYNSPETDGDIIGTKEWVNGSADDRPEVKFELWRKNGTAGDGEKVVDAKAVDATTNEVNFGKQLKTDINGVEYEYYVLEPTVPANYEKIESGLTVTNFYKASGEFNIDAEIDVTKKLDAGSRLLNEDEFSFTLSSDDDHDNASQTVNNAADGSVSFANLVYDQDDIGETYTYKVVENIPADADKEIGMTYSSNELIFTVTVIDAGDGVLSFEKAITQGSTVFNNEYKAAGELDIEAKINPTKSLTGRALTAGEFTFELRQGDAVLQRVTNDAEGNILFSPLAYTEEDIDQTYNYTIVEIPGTEANMSYSAMDINFAVLVKDAGDGVLSLTVNAPADVIFFNTYTPPAPEPVPEPDDEPEPAPVVPIQNFDLGVAPSNVADCFE